jgi:hypothetical protein
MQALQYLEPGTRLKLADGGAALVVENPRDGAWLVIRRIVEGASEQQDIEYCSFDDVIASEA